MPKPRQYRRRDRNGDCPTGLLDKGSDVTWLAMLCVAVSLTALMSCAGWEVRPEAAEPAANSLPPV